MKLRPAILPDPAGIFGIVTFLTLVRFAGSIALQDGDTLWHIKVGQAILNNMQLVATDTYSHTAPGKAWLAHEWLSEVFMAIAYNLGGLPAVVISFFFLIALTYNILFQLASRSSNDWCAFFALSFAAVPMGFTHLLARPHIFTWLFGAIILYLLIHNDKRIWFIPLLIAVWSNLHGGVLLGFLLQGGFIAGGLLNQWPGLKKERWQCWLAQNRRPLFVLVASILASGLNPFGFYLFTFNQAVSAEIFSASIGEWKSADFQSMWYVRIWLIWMFIMAAIQGHKTDWTWKLLVPALVFHAMTHVRHVSIAALFIVPWLAKSLELTWKSIPSPRPGASRKNRQDITLSSWSGPIITSCAFVCFCVSCIVELPQWKSFTDNHYKLPEDYSKEAINFIAESPPGKTLFNEYSWGDYLIYALDPPPPIFIDGRADMYGGEIFQDYLTVSNLEPGMDSVLDRYAIDWVLFPADHALIKYLGQSPKWSEVYRDETTAIMALANRTADQ